MTLQITHPLEERASGGARIPETEWDLSDEPPRPMKQGGRTPLGWPLLVLLIVVLWPAAWGGLTGVSVVNDTSMESVYDTNDVVLTLRQSSYGVGDIVSYTVPKGQGGSGERIIHRIVAVDNSADEPTFSTQGDNNPSVDPWKISTPDVVGKAVLHAPRMGAAFRGVTGLLLGAFSGIVVLVAFRPSRSRAGKPTHKANDQPLPIGHRSGL
ncbi:signal peptidase I [Tessaracoccus sp.]